MDFERLDKLFLGQEYMGAELLTKLQTFKGYTENSYPVVSILCTDNRLRMQMDKLAADCSGADIHVCDTFNGIDDALEKAMYSDAVIVNTLALKIAPDGLYKVLKELAVVGKEIYFILSGWESLPKTTELGKKKLLQVDNEFPFAKINVCRNVFIKPLEGFYEIEDVLADYLSRIIANFEHIHSVQEEALYKALRSDVRSFRNDIGIAIQKEQALVMQLQHNMLAKQKRYEITFSHTTVGVNDMLERFERNVKGIDIDEVLYHIETESNSLARDAYFEDKHMTERAAKAYVCSRILKEMDEYLANSSSSLVTQTDAQISDITNDLLSAAVKLKNCKFIPEYELEELLQAVEQTDKLITSADNYNGSVTVIFNKVRTAVEPKIMAFQFEEYRENVVSSVLANLLSEKEDDLEPDDQEGTKQECSSSTNTLIQKGKDALDTTLEHTEEIRQQKQWEQFCSELVRLLEYSKNLLSALLYDNSKITNEEIDIQSKNTIQDYFSYIIKQLDVVLQSLAAALDTYRRNEL